MLIPSTKGNLRRNAEIDSEFILLVETHGEVHLKPETYKRSEYEIPEGSNLIEIAVNGGTSVCGLFKEELAKFHPINALKIADSVMYMSREKANLLKPHEQEQFEYRKRVCKPCLDNGSCLTCGCSMPNRMYSRAACASNKYPKLLGAKEWKKYKDEQGIMDIEC